MADEQNFEVYAKPQTNEWVRCFAWNAPEGFVKMNSLPPMNGEGMFVADETGEWIIPNENYTEAYNENVRIQRSKEYMSKLPLELQLEAITEDAMGRPEKLQFVLQTIQEIKDKYPKI